MFEHSVYIAAAYSVTAIVLAWCAFAPALRTRRVRARLSNILERDEMRNRQ